MKLERRLSLPPKPALAVASLMVLQVAGCARLGSGDVLAPVFCTAGPPGLVWLETSLALLLIGFIPIGLASFAFPAVRYPAIAVGIAALCGLALQHMLLANGIFHCDGP